MKTTGWAVVKSYWVGFATEAGLDTGPDEWRLPPGQVELVGTGGGACGKPGGAGLVAISNRVGFCHWPDRDGASFWAELWGRWPGAGLAPQVGVGLAAGRDFAAGQVGAGLVVGQDLPQPPAKIPSRGRGASVPMGLCFPCPAESAPPSPSPVSSMSRPAPARGGRCHAAGLKVNLPGCWTLSESVLRTRLG